MEDIFFENKKSFSVKVKKYKESEIDKKVIYYEVEIAKKQCEKITLDKRYSEFSRLHQDLKKIFENLPIFPSKTLFNIANNPDELMKRRDMLDKYLSEIVERPEILSSEPLKLFLCIDKLIPELSVSPPTLYTKIPDFTYGIRDFIFSYDEGILFTLSSDMNIASRLDSYLSNMKKPWQDESKAYVVSSSVGILECYESKKNDKFIFNRLWAKSFSSQAIALYLDSISSQVGVGFDDGSAYIGKLTNGTIVDVVFYEKLHEDRVMGLAIDWQNDSLITISKDKHLKVTNISNKKVVFDCPVSYSGLTNCHYDIKTKRFIASDLSGVVLVYDMQKIVPDIKQRFETTNKTGIRGLLFDPSNNALFTGSIDNGEICVFNIDLIGKETTAQAALTMRSKTQVRVLAWSANRKELYSGHEDGTITIWSLTKQTPIYVIKNCDVPITKLKFLEKDRLLMCASKEKCIKIWQIPETWTNKQLEEERENDMLILKKTEQMLKYQDQKKKDEADSDEELKNWDK